MSGETVPGPRGTLRWVVLSSVLDPQEEWEVEDLLQDKGGSSTLYLLLGRGYLLKAHSSPSLISFHSAQGVSSPSCYTDRRNLRPSSLFSIPPLPTLVGRTALKSWGVGFYTPWTRTCAIGTPLADPGASRRGSGGLERAPGPSWVTRSFFCPLGRVCLRSWPSGRKPAHSPRGSGGFGRGLGHLHQVPGPSLGSARPWRSTLTDAKRSPDCPAKGARWGKVASRFLATVWRRETRHVRYGEGTRRAGGSRGDGVLPV